jgi:hypothetical protein
VRREALDELQAGHTQTRVGASFVFVHTNVYPEPFSKVAMIW